MNIKIKYLSKLDFCHLTNFHYLKQSQNLEIHLHTRYLFFVKDTLMGLFKCSKINNKKVYFIKKNYKPTYFYRKDKSPFSSEETQKAVNIFKKAQGKQNILSLKIQENNTYYNINWHNKQLKNFIGSFKVFKTKEIKNCIKQLSQLNKNFLQGTNEFKILSEQLTRLVFYKQHKKIFHRVTKVILQNTTDINFNFIIINKLFLGKKIQIINHQRTNSKTSNNSKKNYLINPLFNKDQYMTTEFNSIQKLLTIPQAPNTISINDKIDKPKFMSILENSHFLHFIGHGQKTNNKSQLILDNTTYFTLEDLECLTHVPQILILSCCEMNDHQFIDLFFKKGGQGLVVFSGKTRSKSLNQLFKTFYWCLFNKKTNISESLKIAKQKADLNDGDWANLHYYGRTNITLEVKH